MSGFLFDTQLLICAAEDNALLSLRVEEMEGEPAWEGPDR